jgi:hypothetical protein
MESHDSEGNQECQENPYEQFIELGEPNPLYSNATAAPCLHERVAREAPRWRFERRSEDFHRFFSS